MLSGEEAVREENALVEGAVKLEEEEDEQMEEQV